ncbi:MAG: RNA polymerase sigma factor [Patescibacteria group bacterium]|jgi:RNA polymerase sigma-70 factor (ECF subfamily)
MFFVTFFVFIRYNIVRREKSMENDDLSLISACQAGDGQAFGQLYDRYFKKIYSFVYYKISHKENTEDLVAETFYKALNNLVKFDSRKGSFSSWLYRIARNTVIDHYRTNKNFQDIEEISDVSFSITADDDLDRAAQISEIKDKLNRLSDTQREIIVLRVWQQLSYKEISEIVGKSEANCKMIFSRSIKELKLSLASLIVLFTMLIN